MTCLVTDRRRLVGADASAADAKRCLAMQVQFAVEAGVDLVQLRERDLEAGELAELAREMLSVARGSHTRVVVNERLDVALACRADGVHLRGDSVAVSAVRRVAPDGFVVGRSIHAAEEAEAAAGADYLIAGTVFATPSKDGAHALIGLDGLRAIAQRAPAPVLAIGGIDAASVADVARAGAAGCAAIGLFMGPDRAGGDAKCRAVPLRALVDGLRARFDNGENRSLT